MPRGNPEADSAAFTLVELLIVVVILGIAAAVLVPRVDSFTRAGAGERAFRLVQGVILRAGDLAVLRHRPMTVRLDLTGLTVQVKGEEKPVALPDCGVAVIDPLRRVRQTSGVADIVVEPNGNVEPRTFEFGPDLRGVLNPITAVIEIEKT